VWNSIGGFKINGVYSFQTGAPLYFSNDLVTTGQPIRANPRLTTPGKSLNTAAFDTAAADQFAFHLRTLPLTFGNVRTDGINQLDSSLLKDFHFPKGMYAQFRFEVFNTLNHASFAAPAVSSASVAASARLPLKPTQPEPFSLADALSSSPTPHQNIEPSLGALQCYSKSFSFSAWP
jgi:hypothetical protein